MPMHSVWSPDTPYTESDYTPSIYSRNTFGGQLMDHNVPPVPALPLGLAGSSTMVANVKSALDSPTHNRNDTLDSNATAFEEDDLDAQRKKRVMSSDTFFEEDDTPLRERTVGTSLIVDTSLVPTPRRSQGWWNVITTPFVTTPLTGTWPKDDQHTPRTPDVPTLPLQYSQSKKILSVLPAEKWATEERPSLAHRTMPSKEKVPVVISAPTSEDTASQHASPMTVASEIPADATRGIVAHNEMQQTAATPDLVVVFTRRKEDTTKTTPITTQPGGGATSQWLTLTNLPPIPTGVLTIAQPEAVEEESGCVAPTTLWSCALPKELQDSVKPNKPDQPNMKIEIVYDNSSSATKTIKRAANAVSVGAFIREHFLNARAAPSPSPAPPSSDDMVFLGKTTDGTSAPFDGEDTPLFVSFQDLQNTASRLAKRGSGDPTNITASIPAPMLNSDGTAAPANLLPYPSAQPLRLFNRGQDDEHYGFYSYYDRSIFLKQINGTNRGGNPADTDGGSTEEAATLRCTFAQTRFLVQIWTRSEKSKPLLQSSTTSGSSDLKRPGTFPYPVTVTIDRHGGDAAKKNLYCYQMESDGTIKNDASKRSFQFEDRAFGGNLVNGTQGRFNVSGPIDGGSGGCSCKYQNWLD
ncbi:hypothetical protein E8E12_001409 [Didymella heteroderae]|uniref:Uncharacterized protein n=1 Tax=Didymella heteroderae TaxID=1769908 RepID=A0A9P4WP53_9PLEO|nr:hypothetical protein E8E12_001409 [Didymella heteroderae]